MATRSQIRPRSNIGYRLQALDGLSFSGTTNCDGDGSETDLRIHFLEIGIRQLF